MFFIITATISEAKPLIEQFKLKPIDTCKTIFPIFGNNSFCLVISGSGKTASATATAFLLTLYHDVEIQGILNIGIASHSTFDLSTPILAHKIKDMSSEKSYYPTILFDVPCLSQDIITTDKAVSLYDKNTCYDMESFGFFASAVKFLPHELIHVIKIVSDNTDHPPSLLSKDKISSFISSQMNIILSIIEKMLDISSKLPSLKKREIDTSYYLKRFHFATTQKHKLKDVLNNIDALNGAIAPDNKKLEKSDNASDVITPLKEKLKKTTHLF
jgi:hypothetical protein